ncbi:MAG: 50S ribosomal protein L25 [Deltaproteobacteria bacterium]|nr:50S ribosomal protein L25 [Deltaproteobacteria bacterium]
METDIKINAMARTPKKKGQNRRLRRQGLVPGIFYGPNREPQPITLNTAEVRKIFSSGRESGLLVQLLIKDNDSSQESVAMLKDYQVDPIRRDILHVDFYEVDLTKPVQVEVSIELVGEPVGVDEGGLLQQIQRTLLISALPGKIPEQIEVDVSHLNNGDSIHVKDIQLPAGVKTAIDDNITIAIVAPPKGVLEEVQIEEELVEEAATEEEPASVSDDESAPDDSASEGQ